MYSTGFSGTGIVMGCIVDQNTKHPSTTATMHQPRTSPLGRAMNQSMSERNCESPNIGRTTPENAISPARAFIAISVLDRGAANQSAAAKVSLSATASHMPPVVLHERKNPPIDRGANSPQRPRITIIIAKRSAVMTIPCSGTSTDDGTIGNIARHLNEYVTFKCQGEYRSRRFTLIASPPDSFELGSIAFAAAVRSTDH